MIVDYLIKINNKLFRKKITYKFYDWFDCRIYNIDLEEVEDSVWGFVNFFRTINRIIA